MKNTDLIAAVGGIEKAREIVAGAPDGATSFYLYGGDFEHCIDYFNRMKMWCGDHGWLPAHEDQFGETIPLDDLRTAIAEHDRAVAKPEFKVGDLVVFKESRYFTGVYEIEGWSAHGTLNDEVFISGGRRVHESVLCHATPAEIKAGHRIDGALTNGDTKVGVLGHPDDVFDIVYHVSPNAKVSER